MKITVTALTLVLSIPAVAAQDAVTVLPDSYSNQFENEWVRVVRVDYAPHAKLPAHAHNARPAAYVYLNDGGPVLFKHVGTSYGAATRPATKAGSFRDVRTLKGKFVRPSAPDGQNLELVQFENDQVRITHVIGAPGRAIRLAAAASAPSLLIALQAAQLREKDSDVILRTGQERWIPAGSTLTYENIESRSSEFLRFDFKTTPTPSSSQR